MIEHIPNLAEVAQSLLLSQFHESPKLKALIAACVKPFQDAENDLHDLRIRRNIDTAIGNQLDLLGYDVGEPRLGRGDEEYRTAIRIRILINACDSTSESIMEILKKITGANKVQIRKNGYASFQLFTDGPNIPGLPDKPGELSRIMQDIAPAGTGIVPVTYTRGEPFTFGFSPDANPEILLLENSDYLQLDNDNALLISSSTVTGTSEFFGFGEVDSALLELDDDGALFETNAGDNIRLKIAAIAAKAGKLAEVSQYAD